MNQPWRGPFTQRQLVVLKCCFDVLRLERTSDGILHCPQTLRTLAQHGIVSQCAAAELLREQLLITPAQCLKVAQQLQWARPNALAKTA